MNNVKDTMVIGATEPQPRSLISAFREGPIVLRAIVGIVILAFGGLVTSPAVAAVRQEASTIQWHHPDDSAAKLSVALHGLHTLLAQIPSSAATPQALTRSAVGTSTTQKNSLANARSELRSYRDQLASLNRDTLARFASVKEHLQQHHLPQVILDRQAQALATYKTRMAALMTELNAAETAPDAATFRTHALQARAQLDQQLFKPAHEKFDPKHLPFSVAKVKHIKPRLSKRAYQLNPVVKPKASPVALNGMNGRHEGMGSGDAAPAGVPVNPNDSSYLAPTDDVQITPAIQALAKQLNNNPVQIYNWVHNNIEYIPTYGSIQGSDMTLQTLRGNDFDTASLLIALLRASNIPARYVYGTIQVPIAQVENWVGGVTDPNAALNLLEQGGVPATGLAQGGVIQYVQMEHVWVEAYVNFIPSRAARSGPGNTWIPMDASFKQYTYTQGMNLQQAVPFDANAFAQHIVSTSTINQSGSWISGIDQNYIQQQLATFEQDASSYANSLPSGTTVSQVLGSKAIIPRDMPTLAASLPYTVNVIGQRMTSLPANLQDKFQYELDDQYGNVVFDYTANTVDLAGKTLSLSFAPATTSDQQTLDSYAPKSSTGPLTFADFASSLPGYLINLVPQLSVDGTVVATGSAFPMGTDLQGQKGYWTPNDGWVLSAKPVTAGQYQAIGLDLQGGLASSLHRVQTTIQNTYDTLNAGSISGLTKYDIVGAPLQAVVLSYFSTNDVQDNVAATADGVVNYRAPSFGTYSTVVQTVYSFGIPTKVIFPGFLMDIEHSENYVVTKDNDTQKLVMHNQVVGAELSALESQVPEKIYGTSTSPVQAISSGEALSLSLAQGQKVFAVNANNISMILPELNQSSDVVQRIQDAVNAGDQVTVPQTTITENGWTGTGYLIIDPTTGAGAYEIAGGSNGGMVLARIPDAAETYYGVNQHYDLGWLNLSDDMGYFVEHLSWISGALFFTQLLNANCGVGASIVLAVVDTLFGIALSAAAVGLAGVLAAGFAAAFFGLFLTILMVFLAAWFTQELVNMESDTCDLIHGYPD